MASRGDYYQANVQGTPVIVLSSEAFSGVRTRRMLAVCIDVVMVAILSAIVFVGLMIVTLGLSLLLLPPLFPLVAFFYNGLSISGPSMATPGMKAADLEVHMVDGGRVPFLNAAVHAILFYVSWMFPFVFLVSLVTRDKRCLHDILAGVVVTRRVF